MVEQSSIKFVAGALALLLLVPIITGAGLQKADAAAAAGIMVPLYTYPGGTWDTVIETKNNHPSVPIVAIVNPASGPGGSQDSNYVSGIAELKDAGVIVLGYVSTAYTSRSLDAVRGDIDRWDSWYNVDGIFFDEQTNWSGGESYYTQAGDYAESKGLDFTVGNPGANSITSYLSTVDVVLIYESPGLPNLNNYDSWESQDNDQLGMIPFSVGSLPTSWLEDATAFIGWVYVTSDSLPNPWDSLPSYFDDMAALLDDGSSGGGTPDPEYRLTVRSVDQTGSTVTGMWMDVRRNGAAVSTGFSPLSLTLDEGTYTVSAGNYQQIIFDHWSDGSRSSTMTVDLYADSQLTAHYNSGGQTPPQEATLDVQTVNGDGGAINGYYTTLSQNGAVVETAFSPASFTLNRDQAYQVTVSDYGSYAFDHWSDGSTSKEKTVTGGQTTALTAYYRNDQQQPQPSQLTVQSVDLSGNAFTGMWTAIESGDTAVATGFTPMSHTAAPGTYVVSVGDYQNNVFDHWDDGSESRTRTVNMNGQPVALKAYYSTAPREVFVTVESEDLGGDTITGMWTVVTSAGATIETGYTPLTFSAQPSTTYEVSLGNYQDIVFDHWSDGNTGSTRQVTASSDMTLTAIYSTGPQEASFSVSSVDLAGNALTGMWTVISGEDGTVLQTGFTPMSFTGQVGAEYVVAVGDYQNNVFDHWDDGSNGRIKTIVIPADGLALKAYYRR